MKKIFLLSLLSVLFLSAFCQFSDGRTEIITKINITKYIDDSEISEDSQISFMPLRYNYVIQDPIGTILCYGRGWRLCFPRLDNICSLLEYRGISTDVIEKTCENIVEESDALVVNGEYKGSLTKKIAFSNPQFGGKQSFILLQMNWDNDAKKPYNGKAEIIISQTNDFGLR